MKSVDEQLTLIRRGVEQIEKEDELRKKLQRGLKTGTPLRVKFGIDPTSVDVHLGHTVPLRKLRQFQALGHKAVLIIGNYTALVGDPSGRDQTRARLTPEMIEVNARDYLRQVSRIIDISQTEVTHNGDWFGKFSFLDVLNLTSKITVQQMLAREEFADRITKNTEIRLHECLYPLMQGYDSVAVRADVEVGGTDQLFNFMVARDLQRDAGQEPQVCITLPILRGLDGVRRMGKSLGNYIGVGESAKEQFGKTMSIPDELMREWFELLTDRSPEEVARLTDAQQTSPRDAKEVLARDIVAFYHGPEAAEQAAADFITQHRNKGVPADLTRVLLAPEGLSDGKMQVYRLLVALKLAATNNEARRLIQQGGVSIGAERQKVTDPNAAVEVIDGLIVRAGKKMVAVQL